MTEAKTPNTAEARAEMSAGRAAGHCWVEHPTKGLHCTWPPNHEGRPHWHTYTKTSWPQ